MGTYRLSTDPQQVSTLDLLSSTLGQSYAWLLFKFGYKTAADVDQANQRDLLAIPGIGVGRLSSIRKELDKLGKPSPRPCSSVIYVDFRQRDLFESRQRDLFE